jgi:SPP1 gp7 family putative phage head morphogenesis protein
VEASFEEQFDVDELADKIGDLIGDDARAETIARTETMRASNQGQQELWAQAEDAGLLTGKEEQEWIVTPDDRLCPICEPMDGVTAPMGGSFRLNTGEVVDGPPAHPNCRCTIALSA